MDFTQFMAVVATALGIVSTIIGLVNSKSKSDKADAIQIRSIEMKLEDKANSVQVATLEMKIDTMAKAIEGIESDMKSVVHDNKKYGEKIVEHDTRLESLEHRVKKIEQDLNGYSNDGK